jgi:hypothetical protein
MLQGHADARVIRQQRLNAADRAMLTVDRILREMGSAGFETQTLVWTSAPIDVVALRTAIARLSARHPVITARLVDCAERGPHWQFRPGAACPLEEVASSADPTAVLDYAGRLLSAPSYPAEADPVRFHLLHRPNGREVLILQYNHALIDNNAALFVLQEIDRLSRFGADKPEEGQNEGRDLVREYLRRFPRDRRRRAASRNLRQWGRSVRGGVVTLSKRPTRAVTGGVRIATRALDENATRALEARVIQTTGFPSLSMALAGSAFRAIGRLTPQRGIEGRGFVAGIGVDLGLRGRGGLIFQNLVSLVPISARAEELHDRDALVRMLSRQLRERLAGDADLGMLQLVALLGHRPDGRWVIEHALRHSFSLWYAYFGSLDAIGDSFCGAPIEQIYYAGPAWPAVGLTLLVNQHRNRLFLQATYTFESVPETLAHCFLDLVIADLAATPDRSR